jgi:hypothetical protein
LEYNQNLTTKHKVIKDIFSSKFKGLDATQKKNNFEIHKFLLSEILGDWPLIG